MPTADSAILINLVEVSREFPSQNYVVNALVRANLQVYTGDFCAIVGRSGSGKSTLLNILGLLDRPTSGQYFLDGLDVSLLDNSKRAQLRNASIGFVFQSFRLLPKLSAIENVLLPATFSGVIKPQRDWFERGKELLAQLGLEHRLHHRPEQLSGGEKQRVAFARALLMQPKMILADEPTGALDGVTSAQLLQQLQILNKQFGVTIVMITHDEKVAQSADYRIKINDGSVSSPISNA